MKGNDFVSLVLRSPLHPLLGQTMLITVIGRKTGRSITTPVNYCRCGDTLWVLSLRDRTWWRNITDGTTVQLHFKGLDLTGTADVVRDEKAVAQQLPEYIRQLPAAADPLGLRGKAGAPDELQRGHVAAEHLFIRVHLADGPAVGVMQAA